MSLPKDACSSEDVCSITKAIKWAGSEWSLIISYYLLKGPKGFNELLRVGKADKLNSRTLSRTLKVLAMRGIVERKILSNQPFSVSYSLTDKGRALEPILKAYRAWGTDWLTPRVLAARLPLLETQIRKAER